ncbi:MAG: GNAT family N-acetyltransferase [Rhizobiales bacterium]|nr:GNAT family N-acetyltransferase [Rhizobacter sp.]
MSPSALSAAFDPALLSRIEDAGLNASAPPQQRWLDGWLVRFSPGKAKRARCVNAVAEGRLPVDVRLTACAQVFAQAGLPMIVRITPFALPAGLDTLLERQGLRRFDDTRVMVLADLPTCLPAFEAQAGGDISIRSIGLDALAQRIGAFRGSSLAQRQAHAERLLNAPVPFFAFELHARNEPVACGQFALEGDLVGLYDVFTVDSARRQGLAQLLCKHLLTQAVSKGAKHAYLQVEGDNLAARSAYHRLGFRDGYAYHYRTFDPSAA